MNFNELMLDNARKAIEEHIDLIIRKRSRMSPTDIEILCKELCALETLNRIEDGEQDIFFDASGNSYRRSRADSGRFSVRDSANSNGYHDAGNSNRFYDGSNNSGYSGHSKKDRMIDNIEQLLDVAQNDQERQFLSEWLRRAKNN